MPIDKQPLALNPDFAYALDLLEKTDRSLFITGRAGTGKSTLLRLFQQTSKKKLAVLAPTGVAALSVAGQTIHSFFGFAPRLLTSKDIKKAMRPKLFQNLQTLVVDEISMVRADVLDAMDLFLKFNRGNQAPFGGVQMVMIGDLFQLPPVVSRDPVEAAYFEKNYESPHFFSSNIMSDPDFDCETLELRQIFRQGNRRFIDLLECVRLNEMDYDSMEELNNRVNARFGSEGDFITLTAQNSVADRINQTELNRLDGFDHVFIAETKGDFDEKLFPVDSLLRLRKGAQVMFCKNDPDKEFVNGTLGKVERLNSDEIIVKVVDSDGKVRSVKVPKLTWETIRYRADENDSIVRDVVGTFTQYPLKLAWAITIHKAQGKTFDRLALDLGRGAFEFGQVYVALSRSRTLEGIVLKQPLRPSDIMTDERVVEFYSRRVR